MRPALQIDARTQDQQRNPQPPRRPSTPVGRFDPGLVQGIPGSVRAFAHLGWGVVQPHDELVLVNLGAPELPVGLVAQDGAVAHQRARDVRLLARVLALAPERKRRQL